MNELAFLVGQRLEEVRREPGSVRLVFEAGQDVEPALYANIEQPFVLVDARGVAQAGTVDDAEAIERLDSVVGQEVVTAEISAEGALRIGFSDASSLRCDPHPDYEAWQVVGGAPQYLVVCMPGGGEPAVWDSSQVPSPEEAREAVARLNEMMGWNVRIREISTDGIVLDPEPETPESPTEA